MATFIANATGTTTGQAVFSGLSTVSYSRTIYITVNGTPIGTQTRSWTIAANATPSSFYIANFTDLNPSTTYTANCTVYRNYPWEVVYSDSDSFTTFTPPVQPWNWYTPKTDDDMLFPVNVDEWLDFCERINQMRKARGLSEYAFTTNVWGNMPFSKNIFLEAVNALTPFWGLSLVILRESHKNKNYWYFLKLLILIYIKRGALLLFLYISQLLKTNLNYFKLFFKVSSSLFNSAGILPSNLL